MKKTFLLSIITLISSFIFAQQTNYVEVKGTVKLDRTALSGAKIDIYDGQTFVRSHTVDNSGKFTTRLDLNKIYTLEVRKQGYFTKKLEINTKVPKEDVGIWDYRFTMNMIVFIEGIDMSLLNQPIGKIMFVNDFGEFDYDEDYTKAMQRKLDQLMREYEKLKKQIYNQVVQSADKAFNDGDYDLAMSLYDQAIELDPYESYPDDQLRAINRIISQDQNAQKNYDKFIARADELFKDKDYIYAKKNYKQALNYKQNEKYPVTQMELCDKLMNEQVPAATPTDPNDKPYRDAIAAADKDFNNKQYQQALNNYQKASGLKPNEQYPKQKISEINGLLAQAANAAAASGAIQNQYNSLIATADNNFNQKQYPVSRDNYVKASQIKPNEQYPKQRIAEIDKLLLASKANDDKYKGYITIADKAFTAKQYNQAKDNYKLALNIKPAEQYPNQRIAEIDALLLAMASQKDKELNDAYNKAIAEADAAFNSKNYTNAKTLYNQALTIKNNELYPKNKIAEIDQLMAALAAKKRAYDLAISRADIQYNSNSWSEARKNYQEALNIFPEEQYPQSRITEIDNKLLALKNAEEQKKARDKAYNDAITQADMLFNQKKYHDSKNSYNQALALKPGQNYPTARIAEIDRLLQAQLETDDKYNKIIADADAFFIAENYSYAKTTYQNALLIKPDETYPKQKIAEIDVLLTNIAAAKQRDEALQKQYLAIIAKADAAYNSQQFDLAKSSYTQASQLKPTEQYPKQRIVEIDNMLLGLAEKTKLYNQAIATAESFEKQQKIAEALASYNQATVIKPAEQYPKNKVAELTAILAKMQQQQATYENYIKLADAAYTNKELDKAKANYQTALGVKPTEQYPKQRIDEINKLIDEQNRLLANKQKTDALYNSEISTADNLFTQQNYTAAKEKYNAALAIKPAENYPKEKIKEIDALLQSIAANELTYKNKIAEANGLLQSKNYNGALLAYQQALLVKPNEQLPKNKIQEINTILNQQKQTQQQYQTLIAQADNLFNQKNYSQAKPVYQQAMMVMPAENYPKDQISKIDIFMAEMAKNQADLQAKVKMYNAKITEADKLFASKQYQQALSGYMDAKMIKPDETYPDKQMAEINRLVELDTKNRDAAFNLALTNGDNYVKTKQYEQAKAEYNKAKNIKPSDNQPKIKLVELQNIIDAENLAKANQSKIDKEYNTYILQADNAFKAADYPSAMAMYKNAQRVKPDEKYPPERIILCDKKLKEQQALAVAEAEKRKKEQLAAAQKSFKKTDFDYSGEQRDRQFLNELAKQYPEGVTVEDYDKPNKKIQRVIVNRNGIAREYIKVIYSYGTFYFRNGQNISASIFNSETKD